MKKKSTPGLGIIRARQQIFNESENRLLDQITMEINEAWAKDLMIMRKCYKTAVEAENKIIEVSKLLSEKLDHLSEFLSDNSITPSFSEYLSNQEQIFLYLNEIRNEMTDIGKKVDYPLVLQAVQEIKALKESIKSLEELYKKKKWWQFWKYGLDKS